MIKEYKIFINNYLKHFTFSIVLFILQERGVMILDEQELEIICSDYYSADHSYSYWHGENIVNIVSKYGVFDISAIGDVRCTLYAKKDFTDKDGIKYKKGEFISSVKDKNNTGKFFDEFDSYIRDDDHLLKLLCNEDENLTLDVENNNWLVLTFTDNDGNMEIIDNYDSLSVEDAIKDIKKIVHYKNEHPNYKIFIDNFSFEEEKTI